MGYYQRLGAALAEIRDWRGLTQPQLGALTGHAASTISKWESAKAKPKAYDLHIIARALDIPAGLLVDPPAAPLSPVRVALRDLAGGGPARQARPAPPGIGSLPPLRPRPRR